MAQIIFNPDDGSIISVHHQQVTKPLSGRSSITIDELPDDFDTDSYIVDDDELHLTDTNES